MKHFTLLSFLENALIVHIRINLLSTISVLKTFFLERGPYKGFNRANLRISNLGKFSFITDFSTMKKADCLGFILKCLTKNNPISLRSPLTILKTLMLQENIGSKTKYFFPIKAPPT